MSPNPPNNDQSFRCVSCDADFSLPPAVAQRYPTWTPRYCLACREAGQTGSRHNGAQPRTQAAKRSGARPHTSEPAASSRELLLPTAEVLARFTSGPQDGLFTDGACSGNPGPGGWGAVWVIGGSVQQQRHGHEPQTTNNRMELAALIAGYEMLPTDTELVAYSDSQLCVKTINEWAAGWRARGWKRKTGPIANLDLVQRAYELALEHPKVTLRWIKAHNGYRWNEYADALATAYLRSEV